MKLSEYDISHPYEATLLSSDRITPSDTAEVRHLVLKLSNGDFGFIEGQSVGVLLPGPHEFGNPHHFRLYSIASTRKGEKGRRDTISICVRRCFYLDEISGEMYPGKASNFLCNAKPGDKIMMTGPYGSHFLIPADDTSNLLMIGAGTGIAPFRAFVRHIYEERGGWKGKVRLFYGARTGMEMLYRNKEIRDLNLYYDDKTFEAFEAVSPRPFFDDPPQLDRLLMEHANQVGDLVKDPKTYVFVAGLEQVADMFETAMAFIMGSAPTWFQLRRELIDQNRYAELLY